MLQPAGDSTSDSSSDEEDIRFIERLNRPRKERVFRNRMDGFTFWDDTEFYNRFRLSKRVANIILHHIHDDLKSNTDRNHAIKPEQAIILMLRFLATNSYLITVGDFAGIHKSTAGKHLWKALLALVNFKSQYLGMPNTVESEAETKQAFYHKARFPNVIGVIDCTHVKIQSPGGMDGEIYRNRKGFFSLNVQAICNAKLQFLDVVARWPGSVHDARIFSNSAIKERFEAGEFGQSVLLGDSGYALSRYCLVPMAHPVTPRENLYNESLTRTRNTVERAFGVLKRRFPVLSLGMRLNMEKVQCIVVVACILHNIAVEMNEIETPPLTPEAIAAIQRTNNVPVDEFNGHVNELIRLPYLNYFENLNQI